MNECDPTLRYAALALLETFSLRVLPGILRRIAQWKHIHHNALPDLLDDLRQELALDCLLHPETVVHATTRQRHARWMRLAERWVYHQRFGRRRIEEISPLMAAPPPTSSPPPSVPDVATIPMGNGRINFAASAVGNRTKMKDMQEQLELVASRLGRDGSYHSFWRTRLAEALTGLAADLLRDRGVVRLLQQPRSLPDPRGRLRRIRRIGTRFHVRSSTLDERRVVRYWVQPRQLGAGAPRRLLEHSTQLCPTKASTWLWLFEAHVLERNLPAAIQAIRECRRLPATHRVGVALARARLLEVRGRLPAATALLRRAQRRWPRERRWCLVPAWVTAAVS
ncbi:MAG: hypothetical protein ABIP94_11610 [Planctomycetota bacterium]